MIMLLKSRTIFRKFWVCEQRIRFSEICIVDLKNLSSSALNELFEELEVTIKEYSETLIHQLALRDELEYEKELKNQFISLLLSIQKKRRETQADKKRSVNPKRQRGAGPPEPGTVSTCESVKPLRHCSNGQKCDLQRKFKSFRTFYISIFYMLL